MNEELNTFEKHIKIKDVSLNESHFNSRSTIKRPNEKQDQKLPKFNFDENTELSKAKKRQDARSEVESLLKYSIEFENERNTGNELVKGRKMDALLRNTHNDKNHSTEALIDDSKKITSGKKCNEYISTPDYCLIEDNLIEEDYEDNFVNINPSGSVLAPSSNPYNKLEKITEANLELTKNPPIKYSPTKVTFNDNITMLETSEDSDSDDDSDENESTSSVDSKVVSSSDDQARCTVDSAKNNTPIEKESYEVENCDKSQADEYYIIPKPNEVNHLESSNTGKNVLLVKVPNTINESLKICLDISSESENEDVCVGHSKREDLTSVEDILENKTTEKSENITNDAINEDIAPAEEANPLNKLMSSALEAEDLYKEENVSIYHEEYLKIAETDAGITIKITCADGTDFLKSESSICDNDDLFLESADSHNSSSIVNKISPISDPNRLKPQNKCNTIRAATQSHDIERNNNHCLSTRVRKKCVANQNFLIKDSNNDRSLLNNKKQEPKTDQSNKLNKMNDSEILAEKIFKSLSHKIKSDESSKINNAQNRESNSNTHTKQRKNSQSKITVLKLHSKSVDTFQKRKKLPEEVCFCKSKEKERPKSSVERRRSCPVVERPVTAPAPTQRRCCSLWDSGRLPDYNGLHSEYGLSAEQLQERKRDKIERSKARKQIREEKRVEEERKRKENEERFSAWLEKKREQEKIKMIQTHLYYYQPSRLNLKKFCAPTAHLLKIGAYRKKQNRKIGYKNFSVDKFLDNISPQEKRTYKIYLGLSPD